jgi:hypothetical protein
MKTIKLSFFLERNVERRTKRFKQEEEEENDFIIE